MTKIIRNYTMADYDSILRELDEIDWGEMFSSSENNVIIFHGKITELAQHVPNKTISNSKFTRVPLGDS